MAILRSRIDEYHKSRDSSRRIEWDDLDTAKAFLILYEGTLTKEDGIVVRKLKMLIIIICPHIKEPSSRSCIP